MQRTMLLSLVAFVSYCFATEPLDDPINHNANHIFNAVHASMRQWGSSLNHNGMSIFPAVVPSGTLLYHGAETNETVSGLEWVAFERDHALNFAHLYFSPLPGRPDSSKQQQTLPRKADEEWGPIWSAPGFLQVYRAKRDLQLLYLDGSAAAKSSRGTLDTTDLLLRNMSNVRVDAEHDRARHLCQIAREDWKGRIDGFIRMEAGFEIIICSFPDSLEMVEALRTESMFDPGGMVEPRGITFHWLRAAANRYDGIGGEPGRVQLNHDRFFSAFTFNIDVFDNNQLPRLGRASQEVLQSMRHQLRTIINAPDTFDVRNTYDWQAITDMVVQKYAYPLQYLITSPHFVDSNTLAVELNYMLRPYIDTTDRNAEEEVQRCAAELVPKDGCGTARQAIEKVVDRICSTLINAYWSLHPWSTTSNITKDNLQADASPIESLKALVAWLAWTDWKKCKGCDWDEICSVPMFPFGYAEDHDTPRCRKHDAFGMVMDYWQDDDSLQQKA